MILPMLMNAKAVFDKNNVFFYNYTVEEILRTQRLDRDQPWPIEEVESFLRESCRST